MTAGLLCGYQFTTYNQEGNKVPLQLITHRIRSSQKTCPLPLHAYCTLLARVMSALVYDQNEIKARFTFTPNQRT